MSSPGIPLFRLAEQKLAWTDRRQALLARNIANVTTPGFRPLDTKSFSDTLTSARDQMPVQTQARHLSGTRSNIDSNTATRIHSRTPDGNGVVLDEQLTKVADTETQQSVATTIYRKYFSMFSLVLGRS